PKTEKRAGHRRKSVDLSIGFVESVLTSPAKKFRESNAVAVLRQVNRPDVVQRDVGEKRMHAKRQRVKLRWRNLRHLLFLVPIHKLGELRWHSNPTRRLWR